MNHSAGTYRNSLSAYLVEPMQSAGLGKQAKGTSVTSVFANWCKALAQMTRSHRQRNITNISNLVQHEHWLGKEMNMHMMMHSPQSPCMYVRAPLEALMAHTLGEYSYICIWVYSYVEYYLNPTFKKITSPSLHHGTMNRHWTFLATVRWWLGCATLSKHVPRLHWPGISMHGRSPADLRQGGPERGYRWCHMDKWAILGFLYCMTSLSWLKPWKPWYAWPGRGNV